MSWSYVFSGSSAINPRERTEYDFPYKDELLSATDDTAVKKYEALAKIALHA